MDEKQAVFEQLTVNDFNKWSSSALKVHTLKSETIFGNWKPIKNYEKCFLFYHKSSSRSDHI